MTGIRTTLFHAALALAGLVFAYQTWTRVEEDETPVGEVLLAACDAQQLQKLTLRTDELLVTLTPERSASGIEHWMTVERIAKPKTADATKAHDAAEATESEQPQKPKRFLTNKKLDELLKLILPLRASRNLGTPSASDLKGFGMDKIESTLTLECGATTTLEIGGATFGSGDLYARRRGDTDLVLLDGRLLKDLQSAEFNFMQKALHSFVLKDVDEARVTVNGATRRLLHRNRLIAEQATWVDAAAPDQRNELYDNWLTRLSRMTAREYLATGVTPGSELSPPAGGFKEIASVEYFLEGAHKGKLTIARADTETPSYYARSEATRNWVAVSDVVAQQVERDAPVVVGLEEAAPATTPPSATPATSAPATSATPATPAAATPATAPAPATSPAMPSTVPAPAAK